MAVLTIPRIAGYRFDVSANLADAATRLRLSPAGLKAFLRIAQKWGVKDNDARQLLGGISSGSFYALKKAPARRASIRTCSPASRFSSASSRLSTFSIASAWPTSG